MDSEKSLKLSILSQILGRTSPLQQLDLLLLRLFLSGKTRLSCYFRSSCAPGSRISWPSSPVVPRARGLRLLLSHRHQSDPAHAQRVPVWQRTRPLRERAPPKAETGPLGLDQQLQQLVGHRLSGSRDAIVRVGLCIP